MWHFFTSYLPLTSILLFFMYLFSTIIKLLLPSLIPAITVQNLYKLLILTQLPMGSAENVKHQCMLFLHCGAEPRFRLQPAESHEHMDNLTKSSECPQSSTSRTYLQREGVTSIKHHQQAEVILMDNWLQLWPVRQDSPKTSCYLRDISQDFGKLLMSY